MCVQLPHRMCVVDYVADGVHNHHASADDRHHHVECDRICK